MTTMQQRRVLLLGATGLVGGQILPLLLADEPLNVVAFTRRPLPAHPRLEQAGWSAVIPGGAVTQIFCALGTTIRKAGSKEEFRRIDHDMPLEMARAGMKSGATHFLLVSALGANARSRVFYNRVKGETEDDILRLGYRSVTIARPSLLLGPRGEHRRGEELAKKIGWLMPPRYRPVEARDVARTLVDAARADAPGVRIVESREMRALGPSP
ncbi:MAG TPA: oxidoreductase [Thermoanaerobaculia bacterium]|nr:oxidoreductase [Thermoanaerobaculia bacterium]